MGNCLAKQGRLTPVNQNGGPNAETGWSSGTIRVIYSLKCLGLCFGLGQCDTK